MISPACHGVRCYEDFSGVARALQASRVPASVAGPRSAGLAVASGSMLIIDSVLHVYDFAHPFFVQLPSPGQAPVVAKPIEQRRGVG